MSTGQFEGPATDMVQVSPPVGANPKGVSTWGSGRTVLFIAVVSLAGALLVGGVGLALFGTVLGDLGTGVNADGSIDGVVVVEDLTNRHTDDPVEYAQTPPLGGDHLRVWQDCGFYDAPIITEAGVHSLEHGAVWVTYDPDLPAGQVEELQRLAAENAYLLVSPMDGLPSPGVASACGVQLQVDSVRDARLPAFLVAYLQGPQNPEPGAPCSGGMSGTGPVLPEV